MRRILIILWLSFILPLSKGQQVDSIYLEQAGELIKVHYKILNSTPDQVLRVSVLCSINGGLRSQLNSLSGDYGDNVIGGRDNYMILWDVLQDVDELTSAEFFIKAELVKDLSDVQAKTDESFKSRIKGNIILMFATDFPGPKTGLRVGYSGNYGISAQFSRGRIPVIEQFKDVDNDGVSKSFNVHLDLTKRILYSESFQMHLVGGFVNQDLYFYWPGPPPILWREGENGAETGILLSSKHIAGSLIFTHFFANKTSDGLILKVASPVNSFTACFGLMF